MFRRFHKEAKHQTWQLLSLCCEVLNVLFIYLFIFHFDPFILQVQKAHWVLFFFTIYLICLQTAPNINFICQNYHSALLKCLYKASYTRKLRKMYSFFFLLLWILEKKERKRRHLSFHTAQLIAVFLSFLAQEFSKWV